MVRGIKRWRMTKEELTRASWATREAARVAFQIDPVEPSEEIEDEEEEEEDERGQNVVTDQVETTEMQVDDDWQQEDQVPRIFPRQQVETSNRPESSITNTTTTFSSPSGSTTLLNSDEFSFSSPQTVRTEESCSSSAYSPIRKPISSVTTTTTTITSKTKVKVKTKTMSERKGSFKSIGSTWSKLQQPPSHHHYHHHHHQQSEEDHSLDGVDVGKTDSVGSTSASGSDSGPITPLGFEFHSHGRNQQTNSNSRRVIGVAKGGLEILKRRNVQQIEKIESERTVGGMMGMGFVCPDEVGVKRVE
jgi:hypothetical protein